ncbi:MAG: sugar transferase [Gemmatimonadaceae bacterium]|nr:sugar transferase [Gemmatimonadaceae bacterium]
MIGVDTRSPHAKRALDILVSAVGLLVLCPLFIVVAIAVAVGLGRPVLFRQERPGQHGRPFVMVKFRTMRDDRDAQGNVLDDAERLTTFGRWLRASSLDELPELWNVLVGDMSLVGPRPLLMEYLPRYSPTQRRRHDVKPGITGWAQINGRNATSWDERFMHDVWYVDHRSMRLDLLILWRTVSTVFRARGVSQDGHATMSRFTGAVESR